MPAWAATPATPYPARPPPSTGKAPPDRRSLSCCTRTQIVSILSPGHRRGHVTPRGRAGLRPPHARSNAHTPGSGAGPLSLRLAVLRSPLAALGEACLTGSRGCSLRTGGRPGRGALTAEEGPVVPVGGGQRAHVLRPVAHDARQVARVAQAAHGDAVQVHGLDEVAEEGALQPQHVPPVGRRALAGSSSPPAHDGSHRLGLVAPHDPSASPLGTGSDMAPRFRERGLSGCESSDGLDASLGLNVQFKKKDSLFPE